MANYKSYQQEQTFLIPFDVDTNIPQGSFPRFLSDFFNEHADISFFGKKRKNDFGGKPAKHCIMMLKIIFYAFSQGIYSMRELSDKYLMKHIEFIYLSGNQHVDHSTLSRFINLYQEEITEIFIKTVYVANNLGYIRKNLTAIDSTPIRANANQKFTGKTETFKKKKIVYEKMIIKLLHRSEKLEEKESKEAEDQIRKEKENIERLKRSYTSTIRKINQFLDEAENNQDQDTNHKGEEYWKNLTDKDSCMYRKNKKFLQAYNCQAGVDDSGIIVGTDVSKTIADQTELKNMVKKCEKNLTNVGVNEEEIKKIGFLLDRGYVNAGEIGELTREGYDLYMLLKEYNLEVKDGKKISVENCDIYRDKDGKVKLKCPGGQEIIHSKYLKKWYKEYYYKFYAKRKECPTCEHYINCAGTIKSGKKEFSLKKETVDNLDELQKIREKMETWEGRNKYNKRFWLGEHGFGIIKGKRKFEQFLVRGRDKVKQQWTMICIAFNLRKIWSLNEC